MRSLVGGLLMTLLLVALALAAPAAPAAPTDAAGTATAPTGPRPAPAGASQSWYVGDLDPSRLTALATADATRAGGQRIATNVAILDFGDPLPAADGTAASRLADRRGRSTATTTRAAVLAYARGWAAAPGSPRLVLVLGVSNFGTAVGADHGAAWGALTTSVAAAAPPTIDVRGGLDAEPGYAGPAVTRAWVRAYLRSTSRPFVDFGDCGCTPGQALENGWTRADRAAVAAAGSVVPQQYRTSGIDATRWASLSADVRARYGRPMDVLGLMTQTTACTGPPARDCAGIGTDQGPAAATRSLSAALGTWVHAVTDIGYLAPPPPAPPAGGHGGGQLAVTVLVLLAGAGAAVVVVRRARRRRM